MSRTIDLSPAELEIVRDILRARLPTGTQARVFGSRATASARKYSDLDLALEGEGPLDPDIVRDIAEALSESDLPYKADVIDLRSVDPAFRTIIEPDMVTLAF